jgi:nitroreductase
MADLHSVIGENSVEKTILSRRSIRGFLPDPVPTATLLHLLDVAARAPSGSNIQPWKVHAFVGPALNRLRAELRAAFMDGTPEQPDYVYYPRRWRSPYIERRRETGWGLYRLTGVKRGDQAASMRQRARNYDFFGAPIGLILTVDRDLEQGSWLDYGMFLQNIMVAARARGLDSCPQQALANYPAIVARHVGLAPTEMVVCGMALGHADPDEPANRLVTRRQPATAFTTLHDR